jgi:hypothetical protein
VHDIKLGDLVVMPAKRDKKVHVGRIVGPYEFHGHQDGRFVNQRQVEWILSRPAAGFSATAQSAVKARQTLSIVGASADEFRRAAAAADLTKLTSETSDFAEGVSVGPVSLEDARRWVDRTIVARQGAGALRLRALENFKSKCAISDCDVKEALEAAHVVPYLGQHTNDAANVLLLRAGLHTLLDRQLLQIDPERLTVSLHRSLRGTCYESIDGVRIRVPRGVSLDDLRANLRTVYQSGDAGAGAALGQHIGDPHAFHEVQHATISNLADT